MFSIIASFVARSEGEQVTKGHVDTPNTAESEGYPENDSQDGFPNVVVIVQDVVSPPFDGYKMLIICETLDGEQVEVEGVNEDLFLERGAFDEVDEVSKAVGDDDADRRSNAKGDTASGGWGGFGGFLVGEGHGVEEGFLVRGVGPVGSIVLGRSEAGAEVEDGTDEGGLLSGLNDLTAQVDVVNAEEDVTGELLTGVAFLEEAKVLRGSRVDEANDVGSGFDLELADVLLEEHLVGDVLGLDTVEVVEGDASEAKACQAFCDSGTNGTATDDVDAFGDGFRLQEIVGLNEAERLGHKYLLVKEWVNMCLIVWESEYFPHLIPPRSGERGACKGEDGSV